MFLFSNWTIGRTFCAADVGNGFMCGEQKVGRAFLAGSLGRTVLVCGSRTDLTPLSNSAGEFFVIILAALTTYVDGHLIIDTEWIQQVITVPSF